MPRRYSKKKSFKKRSMKKKSLRRKSLRRRSLRGGAESSKDLDLKIMELERNIRQLEDQLSFNFDELPLHIVEYIAETLSEDPTENTKNKCKNVNRYCSTNRGTRKICKESKSIKKIIDECKEYFAELRAMREEKKRQKEERKKAEELILLWSD